MMTTAKNTDTAELEIVKAFAAAVRDQLSDLSADEVQELTDGLEADLHEHYADNGSIQAKPAALRRRAAQCSRIATARP